MPENNGKDRYIAIRTNSYYPGRKMSDDQLFRLDGNGKLTDVSKVSREIVHAEGSQEYTIYWDNTPRGNYPIEHSVKLRRVAEVKPEEADKTDSNKEELRKKTEAGGLEIVSCVACFATIKEVLEPQIL